MDRESAATHESVPALITTFALRDTCCAIDALQVQEVIKLGHVTPVRHAPADVVGIVNLRGRIVSVLDLGMKLALPPIVPAPGNRVLIVEDRGETVGLLVDAVSDVVELDGTALEPPPPNLCGIQGDVITGVTSEAGQLVALLDLGRTLGDQVA